MGQTNLMLDNQDAPSDTITSMERREGRLPIDCPVEITGINHAGHLFTERTLVEDVTEIGCQFETRTQLQCGDVVAVKPLELGEESFLLGQTQLLEVAWIAHHHASWTVGTRKLQGEKLVNHGFPPATYSPRRPAK